MKMITKLQLKILEYKLMKLREIEKNTEIKLQIHDSMHDKFLNREVCFFNEDERKDNLSYCTMVVLENIDKLSHISKKCEEIENKILIKKEVL